MEADPSPTVAELAVRNLLGRVNSAGRHGGGDARAAILNSSFAECVVLRGPGFGLLG